MAVYELFLVLPGKFDESAANKFLKEFESFLAKYDSKINNTQLRGQKPLAYEIKGSKTSFQAVLEVEAPEDKVAIIKEKSKLIDDILRMEFYRAKEAV